MRVLPQKRGLVGTGLLSLTALLCLVGVVGALWFTRLGLTLWGTYRDVTATETLATIHDRPEDFIGSVAEMRSVLHQSAATLTAAGTSAIRFHTFALLSCGIACLVPPDRRILRRVFTPLAIGWLLSFGALRFGREWKTVAATIAEQPVLPSAPNVLSELQSGFATVRLTSISFALFGLLLAALFGIATVGVVRSLLAGRHGTQGAG
jgi:hypothetical protein